MDGSKGGSFWAGMQRRHALATGDKRPSRGSKGHTPLVRICKGGQPLHERFTAQLAGSKGGGYKPPCAETSARCITAPFLRSPIGSLRNGLWRSLALAVFDWDRNAVTLRIFRPTHAITGLDIPCYLWQNEGQKNFGEKPMNVSLTPELESLVQSKVQSGRYQSASEVIREGLRLLEHQDHLREMQLAEVRRKIQTGIDQLDRGEGIDGEEVLAALKKKSETFRAAKKGE